LFVFGWWAATLVVAVGEAQERWLIGSILLWGLTMDLDVRQSLLQKLHMPLKL